MVKRYKGGLISATEATTSTTIASGMWSATTAAQSRKSGAWPSLLATEPPASAAGGTGPTISNVSVTNSSYTVLDDTPYISTSGGYIRITGTGFAAGCTVYVGGSAATSTTFVSSTEVRAQIGAASSNSFMVYVVNPDSSTGILLNAITFSGTPTWVTGATLSDQLADVAFSIQLSATSDSSVTYALTAGSSAPSGTTLYSNGVFAGTVTGLSVDTNYSFSVDAIDAENQDTARTFTVNISLGDTYFNVTPLLLNGDANVWITDSSTNKFLPTISGDTRPTAFSPYDANWSVYLNGASYLDVAASTTFNEFLTGDFTVECWFYYVGTAFTSGPCLLSVATTWSTSVAYNLEVRTGGIVYFHAGDSIPITLIAGGGQAVNILTWNHVAAVRNSGVTTLYVNGFSASSSSASTSISKPAQLMRIGAFSQGGGQQWAGYISNARVVKGQAVYTANFTPSTTSISTTSQGVTSANVFLGCSTNRFNDANTTPKTITIGSGAPLANTFTPFTESDATTGSGYFDGTGDYLDYTGSANLAFGTSDWTIELWVYFTSVSGDIIIYDSRPASTNGAYPTIYKHTDNSFRYYSSTTERIASTTTVVAGAWFHVAVARVSGTTRMFVNGTVQTTTYTDSTTYLNGASRPRLGDSGVTVGAGFPGYISDVRVIKGTGQYTANFTPATSSLTSVTNTQLLILQYRRGENNHRFIDESGRTYLATRNGQVSQGTFSPFSPAGWSAYFDGTGDYLTVPAGTDFAYGLGDFTVEGWVYPTTFSSSPLIWAQTVSGTNYFLIGFDTSGNLGFTGTLSGGGTPILGPAATINTWNHFAVVRTSGTVKVYVNGQGGTATFGAVDYTNTSYVPTMGRYTHSATQLYTGYISNFRIVKGTAVYTGNFTVPTSRLTATQSSGSNIAAITTGTVFLTLQNNRFIDANATPKTITVTGDTKIQAFSPFRPSEAYSPATHGGSAYFDGSGDYLKAAATSMTLLPTSSTGTFTVDGWIYPTTTGSRYYIVGDIDPAGGTNNVSVDVSSTNKVELYWYTGSVNRATSADSIVPNQWNYFAIVVNANAITIYVNSTTAGQTGTTTLTTRNLGTSGWGINGANNAEQFAGYLSSIRWSTGIARTISAIPTAPTEPDKYSTFLMKFNNAGIVDATGRVNFETVADAKVSNAASKFGTGSLYFDGTGDYLTTPDSALYNFGAGSFTIEFWTYITTYTSDFKFVLKASSVSNYWQFAFNNGGTIGPNFNYNDNAAGQVIVAQQGNTTGWSTNTWYHVALVRNGTAVNIYKDGTSVASGTLSGTLINPAGALTIAGTGVATAPLNGYIDDLRITRFARYTANFTAPTSAFLTK